MQCLILAFVFALILRADSVTSASGTFTAFPWGFSSTTPANPASPAPTPNLFWNNCSYDTTGASDRMNVGYLLTNSGGFAGTPAILGSESVADVLLGATGTDPAMFNFVRSAAAYNLTMLFADSSMDTGNAATGTTFGYYSGDTFTPLFTPVITHTPDAPQSFNPTLPGGSYGFYATVCYGENQCETYTTGNGNWGNDSGGAGWNHFALFLLSDGNYAIGFEDANGIFGEGGGDYNDVVIELSAVPEPSAFWLLAASLLVLSFRRIRPESAAWGS